MISLPKLKERKLFQWALAYAACAWTLFQMLALLADTFYWPDVVAQVATVILGVGFFAALLLAWYHGEKGAQRVSGMEIAMLTILLVIAGVGIGSVRAPSNAAAPTAVPALASGFTSSTPVAEQGSIAVLPFVNMSSDPEQEFFSDGVTEELLNVLSKLPELKVAARTSSFAFKGQNPDVREIGRRLGVAHILEGSVRKSGDRVRITAQLIDAREGHHLWSESYDRKLTDIFAVQDEISRAIVQQLKLELSGGREQGALAKQETSDPEAHALVLQGRHFALVRTRDGLERGVILLRRAVARDSAYARAYAELAAALSMQAYYGFGPRDPLVPQAKEAGRRAIELDPALAEGHFALGLIALTNEWDTGAAEAYFRRAIELNPGFAHAHSLRGWLLMRMGRTEEAIASARRATELDPVSAAMLNNLAAVYGFAGQHERAAETYQAALTLQPGNPTFLSNLSQAYSYLNRHAEAARLAEQAQTLDPERVHILTTLAYIYGRAGRRADALSAIRRLEALPEASPSELAAAYAGLGDTERVFSLLERAVEEREPSVLNLGVNPIYDPFRGDPRMRRLLERMNLPVVRQ